MLYRLLTGVGPVEVEVPLKGMYLGPPNLHEWIGYVPSLAGTGRIVPSSELLVVAACICGVVAS